LISSNQTETDSSFLSNPPQNRPIAGALFVLGSTIVFASMAALIKLASAALPNEMVVFARNFFALVFLFPWIIYRQRDKWIKTDHFLLHLLRGAAGLGAMYCYFYSIAHLKLSEAVLLIYANPLYIPLIARIWIKEPVPKRVLCSIFIGFTGIALILKPGIGVFKPVALVGLSAGVLYALAMVSIRRMSRSEPHERIVFYFAFLSTVFSAIPLYWSWQTPPARIWWLLVLIGLLGAGGQLMLTKGHGLAPVARVGPFNYGTVVFATFIGFLFWQESLDSLSWTGAFLVCTAGIVSIVGHY